MQKVRPRARTGLSCWPAEQPGWIEKADRPKELAWRAGGGGLPEERILKNILEAAEDSELKVVWRLATSLFKIQSYFSSELVLYEPSSYIQ